MKTLDKSGDWLPILLRVFDLLARPTPYNILRGFESWDYEHRLRPQLKQLQRARLLERQGSRSDYTLRVTARGCLAAVGGADPIQRWQRSWDGQWRLLLFDLPAPEKQLRLRLWRWLRLSRFGYLQLSVWISPDPLEDQNLPLKQLKLAPDSFLVIEGHPAGLDTDADVVKSAWDFTVINSRYEMVLNLAARGLKLAKAAGAKALELRQWLAEDREAWLSAISSDPLLPRVLLPRGYLGCEAWEQRQNALAMLAERVLVEQNV